MVQTRLPPDQQMLYDSLAVKIDRSSGETALLHNMGEVLHTLLRRRGDAEFLIAIEEAFIEGLPGRDLDQQRQLAAEVLRVVISKRPEIAVAWRALNGIPEPAPELRRAADHVIPAAPPPEPAAPYEFADSEAVVANYLSGVLARRLEIFAVTPPGFPSMVYCHDKPFFLFTYQFTEVATAFATGPLLAACRIGLERRVYRHAKPEVLADAAQRDAFLTDKRPEIWKIVVERLTKLAADQRNAEAKMAAAAADGPAPEFKTVMKPVTRPRVHSILGVSFTLGTETVTRKVKVRNRPSTALDTGEREAMTLIGLLHDMAAAKGLDLPAAADFQLLRTLFEFDAPRYAQTVKEFKALAGHKETTRQYLFERLAFIDKTYSNHLSDLMVVILFYEHGDGRFGFRELYDICVGTAAHKSAVASQRPFVLLELGHRPRELALQLREALKRRLDEETVATAARLLMDCFNIVARKRFRYELDAALTVLAAFPLTFSGDPEEVSLTAIAHMMHSILTDAHVDKASTLALMTEAYAGVLRSKR